MEIALKRKYYLKKLKAIDSCLEKNRNVQKNIEGVLETLRPKLFKLNECIKEYFDQKTLKLRNIDFYNKNLPLFANNKIKLMMERLAKEGSDKTGMYPGKFKTNIGEYNDADLSDTFSEYTISSEEESEFEWNYLPTSKKDTSKSMDTHSNVNFDDSLNENMINHKKSQIKFHQYTKPRRKYPKWGISQHSKLSDKPTRKKELKTELLEMNWRYIEAYFNIDYEDLRKNDYESIAEKLNNTDYLLSTEEPIFGPDVYRQILKISAKYKNSTSNWSPDEEQRLLDLVNLIGTCNWKHIDVYFDDKDANECLKKYIELRGYNGWSFYDDIRLMYGVIVFNFSWATVSIVMFDKTKSQQQTRERFANVLDPVLAMDNPEIHDIYLASFYKAFGSSWTWIMTNKLPHITDNKLLRDVKLFKKKYQMRFAEQKTIATWLKKDYHNGLPLFKVVENHK